MRGKKLFLIILACCLLFIGSFFFFLELNYYPPVLMYHSISEKDNLAVSKDVFIKQLEYLKNKKFKVVSLQEIAQAIKERKRIHKMVAITFDDGYRDNLEAARLLDKYNLKATIFVIVDKLGKEGYLSVEDLRFILNNTPVEIGSHTLDHKYLPELSIFEIEKELFLSRKILENFLDEEIKYVSYPVGGFNKEVLEVAKASGYVAGFTTNRGRGKNIFAIKRIKITNRDLGLNLWAKLSGYYHFFKRNRKPY